MKMSRIGTARAVLIKWDTGNIQGLELVHMKNKGMKKQQSEVRKSRVANYMRMHQSSYVSKQSWARRARVVLGEFWDMTFTLHRQILFDKQLSYSRLTSSQLWHSCATLLFFLQTLALSHTPDTSRPLELYLLYPYVSFIPCMLTPYSF